MYHLLLESTVENAPAIKAWADFLFEKICNRISSDKLMRLSELLQAICFGKDLTQKSAYKGYMQEVEKGDFFPHIALNRSIPTNIKEQFDDDFKNFLDSFSTQPLELYFFAEIDKARGGYSSNEKAIWLNVLHPFFLNQYKEKFHVSRTSRVPPQLSAKILLLFFKKSGLISVFAHEIQHAYDDWRSKGKMTARSKEHQSLQKKAKTQGADQQLKRQARNVELDHPSEVWARMQELLQKMLNKDYVSDKNIIAIHYGPTAIRDLWAKWFLSEVHRLSLNLKGYDRKVSEDMKKRTYKIFMKIIDKRASAIDTESVDNKDLINKFKNQKKSQSSSSYDQTALNKLLATHKTKLDKIAYESF